RKSRVPDARLYYSPLTGYAGITAALAKVKYRRPMLLTEHGIYYRERMMELEKANWIYEQKHRDFIIRSLYGGLKKLWNHMFFGMSKIAYINADRITTLFTDNRQMQLEAGADFEKISIIPNGIKTSLFDHIPVKDIEGRKTFIVALVGRVVSIKDVKTYIWAARNVEDRMPGRVKFKILGSYDEDREYYNDCRALVELLGLRDVVNFEGSVNLTEYYKNVDLVALTSISEGQPLSIMEAMASAIPSVATNVGACKELLYGRNELDMKMGKCGIITDVHSPMETAEAMMSILKDPSTHKEMSEIARKRVKKYYERARILAKYEETFKEMLKGQGDN
ncbi:MAG: GT4 family glycosyltransferase PelF, partial [Vulcanimicrobiota bacterium]